MRRVIAQRLHISPTRLEKKGTIPTPSEKMSNNRLEKKIIAQRLMAVATPERYFIVGYIIITTNLKEVVKTKVPPRYTLKKIQSRGSSHFCLRANSISISIAA